MADEVAEMQKASLSRGLRLVGYDDLAGRGNGGEGLGMHVARGRRFLYIAHERGPVNFSVVDVTDPRRPNLVTQRELGVPGLRSNTLSVWGQLLAVGYQFPLDWAAEHGMGTDKGTVGVELFDLSHPEEPRSLGFMDTSGSHSVGTHFVWLMDDHYAYLSTGMGDFVPTNGQDHQFVVVADISDPTKPYEAGRWWLPGTREGDGQPPPVRHTGIDSGFRPHNVNVYPERPDRAYVGYIDGGVVVLDISDHSAPKLVTQLDYHPPMPGFTHTVLPLFSRDCLIVSEETGREHGEDHPKCVWVVDSSSEQHLLTLATFPMPEPQRFRRESGRYGPHNVHENDPHGASLRSEDQIFCAFFNAGVRVFDVRDPFRPMETAYFVPPKPKHSRYEAVQINDVYVDETGIVYAIDRFGGGLYILEASSVGGASEPGRTG